MNKRIMTITALAAAALGSQAFAGAPASKPVKETITESCISGDIGFDITNAYYFHGIRQEDRGFIIQPYMNLYFKVYEGSGFLSSLSLNVGTWSSFHSDRGTSSSTNNWYEFDFLAGVTATLGEKWTLGVNYISYQSPGDYFGDSTALGIRLGYDDKDLWGSFSLQPYVYVEIEMDQKSGNGSDEGVYYEVGIAPSHSWGNLTLALPIKAGFGSNDYYATDEAYGFFSVGLTATYALTFIPECLGDWSLSANVSYMNIGDGAALANDGEDDEVIFGGGLKIAF
jgi:uncharacterized protein (TIGR02001 family)